MHPLLPPCRHRGRQVAVREWECRSPRLHLPTGTVLEEDCRFRCPYRDHELPAELPRIEVAETADVAISVLSAPRTLRTIETTIRELRRGGFGQLIHVFEEPGTNVQSETGLCVTTNDRPLGLWDNWRSAAAAMLDQTEAPYILMCEDDLRVAHCAALALQHAIQSLPYADWGYASLYTPWHNVRHLPTFHGWRASRPSNFWGALAYCYTRESLERALGSREVRTHRHSFVDVIVSQAFEAMGRRCWFHAPSLVSHAGTGVSTLGNAPMQDSLAVNFDYDYRGYVPVNGAAGAGAGCEVPAGGGGA